MKIKAWLEGTEYATDGENCFAGVVSQMLGLKNGILNIVKGEHEVVLDSTEFVKCDLEKIRSLGVRAEITA